SVVVGTESLKEIHHQAAVLWRTIRELVPGPVIFTNRNRHVLIDIEWRKQPLGEDIHDIVITVRTVIEFNSKSVLPLLGLEQTIGEGCMKDEALEIQFSDTGQLRPWFEINVKVVAHAVGQFDKSNLGIEVWADFSPLCQNFQPVGLIVKSGSDVRLAG